jgi:hypothetical protein
MIVLRLLLAALLCLAGEGAWAQGTSGLTARPPTRALTPVPAAPVPAAPIAPSLPGQPPNSPFLRIAAEFHTQVVNGLALDPTGKIVATVSDDKTLRVWQSSNGAPLAVLRVPIGDGEEGALYAVAFSPDGQTLLASGYTGAAWDRAFAVYIFDVRTQRLKGRLPNLPGPVNHIAYAPDGRSFAVALGNGRGIRLFDATNGALLGSDDESVRERTSWVAFARDGRFASANGDGEVRLYDPSGRRVARRIPLQSATPYSVAFSADGRSLAVGYADQPRVEVVSGIDLSPMTSLAGAAAERGGLGAVAWARDGRLLAAGSLRDTHSAVLMRSWVGGRGRPSDIAAARDTVFQIEPAEDGGVFLVGADPVLARIGRNGRDVFRKNGPGLDFRDVGDQAFMVSADGSTVDLQTKAMRSPVHVDMLRRSVMPGRVVPPLPPRPGAPVVTDWRNGTEPKIDLRPVPLDPQELSRSYAATPDGGLVLFGTDYRLVVMRRDGLRAGSVPVPAPAWGIGVSQDGATVVAALGDGTLRWYSIDRDGSLAERVSVFLTADGARWAAWSPDGHFDHSTVGGKELVGFHLNRARAEAPDWFSFAQVYRLFYDPDLITRRIRGDLAPNAATQTVTADDLRALQGRSAPPSIELAALCWKQAGAERCQELASSGVARGLRPVDAATVGEDIEVSVPPDTDQAVLRYRLRGADGLFGPVDAFMNGRNAGRTAPQTISASSGSGTVAQPVPIDGGVNHLQLRAYNQVMSAYAVSRVVNVRRALPVLAAVAAQPTLSADLRTATPTSPSPQSGPKPSATLGSTAPQLFVLAVGINEYIDTDEIPHLNFAVSDAKAFAAELRARVPAAYSRADITEIYDGKASSTAVLEAIERIGTMAHNEDTVLIYFSGHGIVLEDHYYFVTQNVLKYSQIKDGAVSDEKLVAALSHVRARNAMMFLDTCFAGGFSLANTSKLAHESGRYVLAGATSVQEERDSYDDKNGIFATAVLRGLRGAPGTDPAISNIELGFFASPLVGKLAQELHHDQNAKFTIADDDARPFAIVSRLPEQK